MKKVSPPIILSLLALLSLAGCGHDNKPPVNDAQNLIDNPAPDAINYSVVTTYPHDITSFTEGLLVHQGKLYESTGSPKDLLQTRSLVGVLDLSTGKIDKRIELDRQQYFGEGIVFLKDKLYQLTYQTKVGFVYDARTFRQLGTFSFPSAEGWGMTTDGTNLIMSDGTNQLTFLDPISFKVVKVLHVNDQNGSLDKLNELEFIQGFIYANVYTTAFIVKIDPTTGKVLGKMDFTSLGYDARNRNPQAQEMNGIAYDSTSNQMYVTGKFWANIYQVNFNH